MACRPVPSDETDVHITQSAGLVVGLDALVVFVIGVKAAGSKHIQLVSSLFYPLYVAVGKVALPRSHAFAGGRYGNCQQENKR